MNLEIKGTIVRIASVEQVNDTFKKRTFDVKVSEIADNGKDYSQTYRCELVQDNVSKIEGYKAGDEISVNCNLRGREYIKEGKEPMVFMSLAAWKLESLAAKPVEHGADTSGFPADDDGFPM